MVSMQETAYPRLKNCPNYKELEKLFSPTSSEISWAKQKARNPFSQLGLLIMLKTFQCLNYFLPIRDTSSVIIEHIARKAKLDSPDQAEWDSYHRSGTGIRQIAMIREYRQAKIFNNQAHQIMLNIMKESILEKDEKSDIINIAIDELIKNSYELLVFSTLTKAIDHVHAEAYRTLYQNISNALTIEEKQKIDQLFQGIEESTYSDWNVVKQDPGRPTLYQLRRWIYRKKWLDERQVRFDFYQRFQIPPAKIERLAAEAKTLDASRMKKLEPHKRYTLAVSLLSIQLANTIDDIGEMYIKRIASAHKKSESSLQKLKKKKEKQLDGLITILRNTVLAFQSEGSIEEKFQELENLIGGDPGLCVLDDCEDHLAYAGNNYFSFSKKNKLYQDFRELGSAIRTLFLLKYLFDEKLRSTIQAATNKSESFNGCAKWLFFGGEGIIAENNRERQRKIIKYNHLVANCLIFYNVFQLTQILHEYIQEGNKVDEDVLSDLSPYVTFHVNRFGKYRLDSNRRPPDIEFDTPVSLTETEEVS